MARPTHCCCFTVRTGTIVLAVLGLLGAASNLLSYGGAAAATDASGESYSFNEMLDRLDATFREWREHGDISEGDLEQLERYISGARRAWPYIVASGLTCAVICLIKHVMLLFGVLYKKSCLFLPYLVLGLASLMVSLMVCFSTSVLAFLYTTAGVAAVFTSVWLAFLALGFYFWHVVLAHYYEVRENSDADRLPIVIQEQPPAYENKY